MAPLTTTKIGESLPKYPNGRLADYLGLPSVWNGEQTNTVENIPEKDFFNMFPLLAYQKVILDWYSPQRWVEYLGTDDHELVRLKKMLETVKKSSGGKFYNYCANLTTDPIARQLFTLRNVNWNNDLFTMALPTPTLFNDVKIPFLNDQAVVAGDGLRISDYSERQGQDTNIITRYGFDSSTGDYFNNEEKWLQLDNFVKI